MSPDTVDDTTVDTARPSLRERLTTPEGKVAMRVGVVVGVLTLLLLAFGVWWPIVSLPTTASDTQEAVKATILVFSIAAAPVMALVWGVGYYSLRHWRARRGGGAA